MVDSEGIALNHLQVLAEQVGLRLTPPELEHLKPMFDFYAAQIRVLHDLDLAAEDLAVVYSPNWDPQG
ncbi:MAG TPA: hypothetical protein VLQ80_33875 [Candidatus Saccharimonadia bacterium]|nr:hypothetical protein [Candidatus Saccharimonadia bacterium]